jgi:hypothetical protein
MLLARGRVHHRERDGTSDEAGRSATATAGGVNSTGRPTLQLDAAGKLLDKEKTNELH